MQIHTGEKPNSCTQCDYSCACSNTLKRHMRVHTGEKQYSCTQCDYSCAQSNDLKKHMRIHTRKRPFSCTQCDYTCSHSTDLKRHLMRVHSGENRRIHTVKGKTSTKNCTLKRPVRIPTASQLYSL